MRKINLYCVIIISLISVSCSDFLDRNPYGVPSENIFYKNKEQATYAVNSCYSMLRNLNGFWATGVLIYGNLCSDDCTQDGAINAAYVRGAFDPGDNYLVTGSFVNAYKGIARCNEGIINISNMTDDLIDITDKNQLLGQMRFIRAFWYYHLVRLYGAVPLLLEPVDLNNEALLYPSRSSIEEIYEQAIIPDFTFAAENLPASYDSEDKPRITSGAARAYLSAAYLLIKDYANAIKEGEEVVKLANEGVYELVEDMESLYMETNEFNKESILEVAFNREIQNWKTRYFGSLDGGICRGEIYPSTHFNPTLDLINSFSLIDGNSIENDLNGYYNESEFWKNRDPRFNISFYTPLDTYSHKSTGDLVTYSMDWVLNKNGGGVDFQKNTLWYGDNETNVGLNNVLMRYAEVLLNLAEAYVQTNDLKTAEKYINQVRTRARNYAISHADIYIPKGLTSDKVLPNVTILNQEDGMEKIRYERRVEFAGENIRGYDLRRWNIEKDTWAKVQGFIWDDKMKLLPIPSSEMSNNPNLRPQNPGY